VTSGWAGLGCSPYEDNASALAIRFFRCLGKLDMKDDIWREHGEEKRFHTDTVQDVFLPRKKSLHSKKLLI
jgi:hypothetical protein